MKNLEGFIVPAGEARGGEPLHIFGDRVWIKTSGEDTGGSYAVMETTTQPEAGPPLHCHGREDESFYVIEGEYRFVVDGKEILAHPGDVVYAPRGTVHTFQNAGERMGRMLVFVQPAGLDEYFKEIAAASANVEAPDPALLLPIFHKHGLELLGPPLAVRELVG